MAIDDPVLPISCPSIPIQTLSKLIRPVWHIQSSTPLTLCFETQEKLDVAQCRILLLPEGGSEWQMYEPASVSSEGVIFYATEFCHVALVQLLLDTISDPEKLANVVKILTQLTNITATVMTTEMEPLRVNLATKLKTMEYLARHLARVQQPVFHMQTSGVEN